MKRPFLSISVVCLSILTISVLIAASAHSQTACLIPSDQIVSGGVGRDAIPSLTNPEVVTISEGDTFMLPDDQVPDPPKRIQM